MVAVTDLLILFVVLGGGLYLFKDKLPFLSSAPPKQAAPTPSPRNGAVGANGAPKYSGDPRDFVAKMKDGVSACPPLSFPRGDWIVRASESEWFLARPALSS